MPKNLNKEDFLREINLRMAMRELAARVLSICILRPRLDYTSALTRLRTIYFYHHGRLDDFPGRTWEDLLTYQAEKIKI